MDLYGILGINKSADKEGVKKSYRQLSKVHHPDAGGDKEKFGEISKAYQILMDDDNREKYDNGGNIDDLLKNTNNMHLTIISEMFQKVMANIDPETQDVIDILKKNLEALSSETNNKTDIIKASKKKLEIFLKKLKHKNSNNILAQVAQNNISNLDRAIQANKEMDKHLQKALEVVKDFGYDIDTVATVFTGFSAFSTTTTF